MPKDKAIDFTIKHQGKMSAQYLGHTQRILSYVLCANNSRVVSQDADGLHLWCTSTGKQIAYYPVGEGEEYYITNDENYLIASTFDFDPLDDNHCYQSLYIFYIGKDKQITKFNEREGQCENSLALAPCIAPVMVVESLAIWCELKDQEGNKL